MSGYPLRNHLGKGVNKTFNRNQIVTFSEVTEKRLRDVLKCLTPFLNCDSEFLLLFSTPGNFVLTKKDYHGNE